MDRRSELPGARGIGAARVQRLALASAILFVSHAAACGRVQRGTVSPGAEARALLTAERPSLTIEVIPVAGRLPSSRGLSLMVQRAIERCNKPGGVNVVVDPEVSLPAGEAPRVWTLASLARFEAEHRRVLASSSTFVLVVLFVDGSYEAPGTIGLSYGGHSIALFRDRLAPEAEGPTLVHELGHELGLVNSGTPMQTAHEDTAHARHDVSFGCVMFHELEARRTDVLGTAADDFDAECKYDLKVAGGR